MSPAKIVLFTALGVCSAVFAVQWLRLARDPQRRERPTLSDLGIGLLCNFLDGLGIGSYAPTTALYKFRGRPADELIPGTLNVGSVAVGLVETVVFVTVIAVEPKLLVAMVASATAGAWLGAGVVSRMRRRPIQLFMGAALLIAAVTFVMGNLGAFPVGGTARGLAGWAFAAAVTANFIFGALNTIGIGWYAPSMVVLALLGLTPIAAFPIMMASGGIMLPVAGLKFLRTGRFAWGAALGMTLGGTIGVLIAVFIVHKLPLYALRWFVAAVVAYAAVVMLRSALRAGAAADDRAAREDLVSHDIKGGSL
ncbi:MAG TPA: sulfite exporter TauE/SafE family protein [Steroidobacteraceae bacterium]|nr:sulfite exporter TauE/SafE family protein [Steroidobacteraceae bacterium]